MPEKILPQLPDDLLNYLNKPYGGLFGNTTIAKIVEEIVADPTMEYHPKYLEEMTGVSAPAVRESLKTLTKLGLIDNISEDPRHPAYRVNIESKKFVALSLLAYAMLDDRDGSDCMNTAILDYYHSWLRYDDEPLAMATDCSFSTQSGECYHLVGDEECAYAAGAA